MARSNKVNAQIHIYSPDGELCGSFSVVGVKAARAAAVETWESGVECLLEYYLGGLTHQEYFLDS